jgi:hypothetical protein
VGSGSEWRVGGGVGMSRTAPLHIFLHTHAHLFSPPFSTSHSRLPHARVWLVEPSGRPTQVRVRIRVLVPVPPLSHPSLIASRGK